MRIVRWTVPSALAALILAAGLPTSQSQTRPAALPDQNPGAFIRSTDFGQIPASAWFAHTLLWRQVSALMSGFGNTALPSNSTGLRLPPRRPLLRTSPRPRAPKTAAARVT